MRTVGIQVTGIIISLKLDIQSSGLVEAQNINIDRFEEIVRILQQTAGLGV